MRITGYVCGPRLYQFDGWFFEWHSYCGPHPLRKDGEPRQSIPARFWQTVEKFQALTEAERESYRVGGGCIPIGGEAV